MATSSQKFIGRNRAPRVQIEYDVETYGSERKIQLPFVMAVLAVAYCLGAPMAANLPNSFRSFQSLPILAILRPRRSR